MRDQAIEAPRKAPARILLRLAPSALLIACSLLGVPLHSTEEQETVVTIRFPSSVGEVEFQHLMHVSDFGIICSECHHETNAGALDTPHPTYIETSSVDCSDCHRQGVEASEPMPCSHCHPDTPADIADERLSSKVVIHEVCWRCHEAGRGQHASRTCGSCHESSTGAE